MGGEVADNSRGARSTPVSIGVASDWTSISAGEPHKATHWRTACARYQYFCGIKLDGSSWCGDRETTLAQRGDATDWVEATPACGVRASGSLLCQLGTTTGTPIDTAKDWMSVGAADPLVCGVKRNGTLWCGGTGQSGELGHGDAWRTSPVQVLTPR